MTLGALRLRLIDDWHAVLTKAWSVRLLIPAVVLDGLNAALPYLPWDVPAGPLATISGVTTAAALAARFTAQKSMAAPEPPVQCSDWSEPDRCSDCGFVRSRDAHRWVHGG